MQIALPDELKKWCRYDIQTFSYILREDAPPDIVKKFKEYKERSLERYN